MMWKLLIISFLLIHRVTLTELSYYEVLGISKHATQQEVRQAYKKLAIKLHPDKNKNTGVAEEEKFLKITEAYEILKDPEKRRKYNLYGKYTTYGRPYDSTAQAEYNNMFYNGLYHDDEFVDTLSGKMYSKYIDQGFHFINFYSPFCPPCQSLCEHWKKLAKVYKGIVKVGAVNCKYHNSFCYNNMRINSYPTLIFYPYGKDSNFVYYTGERSFEGLERFVQRYLRERTAAPLVWARARDVTALYVLGAWLGDAAVMRVAYHLKGILPVYIVDSTELVEELSQDPEATAVLVQGSRTVDIRADDEETLLRETVAALPGVDEISPERFRAIRTELRNGYEKPWVIYFSSDTDDQMELYKMRVLYPDYNFGTVNCDSAAQLCASLDGAPGAWGALKRGGAWQRAAGRPAAFLRGAPRAHRLHSLSAHEGRRLWTGEAGVWLVAVIPPQDTWEDVEESFVEASRLLERDTDIQLGILSCKSRAERQCGGERVVLVQNRTRGHEYAGRLDAADLVQFLQLLKEDLVVQLDEQQLMEAASPERDRDWLVSYLPARCGRTCHALRHDWRRVAHKLRPLAQYRVGVLDCARADVPFCANVRAPTVRLYPRGDHRTHVANMEALGSAPYLLEWSLARLRPVEQLNWHSFSQFVIAEDLLPKSDKKPWLVYFHSPRCHHCYEMYADFAIAAIMLDNAVQVGKVNCLDERGLCQHERITSYPSLRLYQSRSEHRPRSSVTAIPVREYDGIVASVRPHLASVGDSLPTLDTRGIHQGGVHFKHDEF